MLKSLTRIAQGALIGVAGANEMTGEAVTQVTSASSVDMLITVIVMAVIELASRWFNKTVRA